MTQHDSSNIDTPATQGDANSPHLLEAATSAKSARPRGRPRQADINERLFEATLTIFGARGWSGFSIDAVAAEAKVGKTAVYRRWQDKMQLFADAIQDYYHCHGAFTVADATEGSVRERLIAMVRARAHVLFGRHGLALARLQVEMLANPDIWKEYVDKELVGSVLRSRHWLQEAIDHGEVGPVGSAMQILEAIEGSVWMHAMVTPPHLRDRVLAAIPEWSIRLVDTQLGLLRPAPG